MEDNELKSDSSNAVGSEDLVESVRKQIEYYFSKENLQTDHYLTSQMDANNSVPISVVMKFSKLKALTQDEFILRQALENSSVKVVDNRIKVNVRSNIILRDIPSEVSEDSIREIFNYEGCKPITSIRPEIGNTWFVTFESEEEAKETLIELRVKQRKYNDKSIKARLKTESLPRTYYNGPNPPQVPRTPVLFPPQIPFGNYMTAPMPLEYGAYGFTPPPQLLDPRLAMPIQPNLQMPPQHLLTPVDPNNVGLMARPNYLPTAPQLELADQVNFMTNTSSSSNDKVFDEGTQLPPLHKNINGDVNTGTKEAIGSRDMGNSLHLNPKKTRPNMKDNTGVGGRRDPSGFSNRKGNSYSTRDPKRERDNNHDGHRDANHSNSNTNNSSSIQVVNQNIEINALNFPPLGQVPDNDGSSIPTPGYKATYQKYSFDEVITIVQGVKDAILPIGFDPALFPDAMVSTPNLSLLKGQRTFSIDETREQLRQGRPVHREAIMTGAVDYRSMMFGDEATLNNNKPFSKNVDGIASMEVDAHADQTNINSDVSKISDSKFLLSLSSATSFGVTESNSAQSPTSNKISSSWASLLKQNSSEPVIPQITVKDKNRTNSKTVEKSKSLHDAKATSPTTGEVKIRSSHDSKPNTKSSYDTFNKSSVKEFPKEIEPKKETHMKEIVQAGKNQVEAHTDGSILNQNEKLINNDESTFTLGSNASTMAAVAVTTVSVQTDDSNENNKSSIDSLATSHMISSSTPSNETLTNSNKSTGSVWGGKLSFVHVVKQNSEQSSTVAVQAGPITSVASTQTTSNNKPAVQSNAKDFGKENSNKFKSDRKDRNNSHYRGDKHSKLPGIHSETSNGRNSNNELKRNPNAMGNTFKQNGQTDDAPSNGEWIEETNLSNGSVAFEK